MRTQRYIDPHIHMSSRTTDDYTAMADAGVTAVIEPASWVGQPRTQIGAFHHYFSSLVGWERFRASQFGIRHYCAIGLNAKEANNQRLAEQVMELLPVFACKEGVVAIGEVGFDEITALEEHYLRRQLELARELEMVVLVHTPEREKRRGTLRSMDLCAEHRLDPARVVIDHNNEETARIVLERGHWAAFNVCPKTERGNEQMVEIVLRYGSERVIAASSADWGVSDPLAVPKAARLMMERGISAGAVERVCYANALAAYAQSGRIAEADWLSPPAVDQRELFDDGWALHGREPGVDPTANTVD